MADEDTKAESAAEVTHVAHETDPSLLESYRYISSVPGKDVRGKLVDCFQLWFRVESPDVLATIKDIIGRLHNASLMIDDIEDNSKLRRGNPVAHHIFGIAPVLNTANYVYFLALEKCHAMGNPQAMQVFVSEILNLHRGQGHDIMWRDNNQCPAEEEYCNMVIDKTGGLFRLAVGLMQAFATNHKDTDFSPLVNNLGLYFQIRDDLINLADEEYFKSKSFCEDLTEGKFSFPIIHCVRKDKSDKRLLSILKQRTDDDDVKRYAQSLMKQAGSLHYTWEKCMRIKEEIVAQVKDLGGNPPLLKLIEKLHTQVGALEDAVSHTEHPPGSPPMARHVTDSAPQTLQLDEL
uniref:Geranylgeranyl diphosphate synthase n=1 Tax=Trieres chinensis TaxID=1514140 RepID=A0A7S1ZPT9_TRICV|mmetsp:Transcript_30012/g.61246  ORF Transcript_30012/g.61246 Transcript_30012/m.61246 type:complete len:348 (+) Transcript_30012:119-1162(+)